MTEPQRQLLVLKQTDESAFLREVKRIEELLEFCYSLQDAFAEAAKAPAFQDATERLAP
jgi:hypothetical protein